MLDHAGITDVICLMGFYTSTSMTFAFYDVRPGAEGLRPLSVPPSEQGENTIRRRKVVD
jgi:hypothetical protein